MVHRTKQRAAPGRSAPASSRGPTLALALSLAALLALAAAGPTAAAPRDGAGEPLPVVATLHQLTDWVQAAFSRLPGWIGGVWDRLGSTGDPDGTPVADDSLAPQSDPAAPVATWGRAAVDMDPNGTPASTGDPSSLGATSWGPGGGPAGG